MDLEFVILFYNINRLKIEKRGLIGLYSLLTADCGGYFYC